MTCSACGNTELELFLDLGRSPVADAYTATADEVAPTYPLQVATCSRCGLAQMVDRPPAEVLFGSGYSFFSSTSPQVVAYHEQYAADVRARYPQLVADGVVEVGCNDGDLLRHFADDPHWGIDPAGPPTELARQRGLNVITAPFGFEVAKDLPKVGVVIANHILAHAGDASDVLAGVSHLLDDGVALVEVQYLPDLLVNNAFDLIYHEHRNFFSLTTLAAAAARHDLYVIDAELTDRQGGSLRATLARFHHGDRRLYSSGRVEEILAAERWLDSPTAYEGMQARAERIRTRLQDLVAAQTGVTAVYGAPAKATTLLNFCGFTAKDLAFCTDTTPAKWGRHIPGTGIPIQKPGVLPDTYLLAVWNYAGSVMRANPGPRWILPLPAPMLL